MFRPRFGDNAAAVRHRWSNLGPHGEFSVRALTIETNDHFLAKGVEHATFILPNDSCCIVAHRHFASS
jgi:hypothetical protein